MKNKVGILGGGQLARMLALRAFPLGLQPFVLSPSKEDPAGQVTPFWQKGNPFSAAAIARFLKKVDALTFESEFVPAERVEQALETLSTPRPAIAPSLKNLSLLQDRLTQKQAFEKHKLNTAEFIEVTLTKNAPGRQLSFAWETLGPFVLKTRTGGYDGYGTWIIKNKRQIKTVTPPFSHFIAEKWIPFKRELALTAVRNKRGDTVFPPLVETRQKNARCFWVRGPVRHKKLPELKNQIAVFLKKTDYQGAVTFELFDTGNELIINEVAPRVHNSAHHSLNSLTEDQFTLHLKAILNFPLQSPRPLSGGFAMLNLLGSGAKQPKWSLPKDAHLHWYGKGASRKGRKMGHINTLDSSPLKALQKALRAGKNFKV